MSNFQSQHLLTELEVLVKELSSSEGFFLGPLSFEHNDSAGLGLIVGNNGQSVPKNSRIIQVPFRNCISVESITSSPGLKHIFEEQDQLLNFPDEVLAIGLMYGLLCAREHSMLDRESTRALELVARCPWLQHVKTLPSPESFNTTLFWSDDELLQLKGCSSFHLTQLMKKQIEADWDSVHVQLMQVYPNQLGGATKSLYQWALSVVYSRALGFTRRGSAIRCIPPVLDMANHDPHTANDSADTFAFDDELDAVVLLAARDYSAGEECNAVYGRYPNSKLAYTYGFVIHGNPHHAVDLWARVPANSFAADRKRQLLASNPLTAEQTYDFTGTLRGGGWISPALLATIRVIQINSEEELEVSQRAFRGEIISVRNEAASYSSILALLTNKLAVDSAETDRVRLGQLLLERRVSDAQSREFMSLVIRCEERELVRDCISAVNQYATNLDAKGEAHIPPDSVVFL